MNARIEPGEQRQTAGFANDHYVAAMYPAQPTLSDFLATHLTHLTSRRVQSPGVVHAADAEGLGTVIVEIAQAVKTIAARVAQGAICGSHTAHASLGVVAHAVLIAACERSAGIAGLISPGIGAVSVSSGGRYVLFADPLDGAANAESNAPQGTVFSIRHADTAGADAKQIAAGYALYGPATVLVITVGHGTHGFTLCRERGEFVLTHGAIRIPEQGVELAINGGNERFWEPPVRRYMSECKDGVAGVRQRDFDTRWVASLVADTHRTLMHGGLCLYPRETRRATRAARQPLLYQAQSLSWLVEQAGGLASTGRARFPDMAADADTQACTPLFLGTQPEVERIERYHREHERGEDRPFSSPLFNERSLFRPEARA